MQGSVMEQCKKVLNKKNTVVIQSLTGNGAGVALNAASIDETCHSSLMGNSSSSARLPITTIERSLDFGAESPEQILFKHFSAFHPRNRHYIDSSYRRWSKHDEEEVDE